MIQAAEKSCSWGLTHNNLTFFFFTFFTSRPAQAAGERLHNKLGQFQVKELPELWIPFSSPPCSSSQRLLPAKIPSLAIKAAFIWIWESMRAKKKNSIAKENRRWRRGSVCEWGAEASQIDVYRLFTVFLFMLEFFFTVFSNHTS